MADKKKVNPRKWVNPREEELARALDEYASFEEFQSFIEEIREGVRQKMTAEQLLKKVTPLAAARLGNIALTETDNKVALQAIKEILARTEGTPTQKQEITHKYSNLTDAELEAMIRSEEEELRNIENSDVH